MSGDVQAAPEVWLPGSEMVGLISAAGAIGATLDRYAIGGGVAVAARVEQFGRATADVDAVFDYRIDPTDAVQALLGAGATPSTKPSTVLLGTIKVDLLAATSVTAEDIAELDEAIDRLFAGGLAWALDSASRLTLVATHQPSVRSTVLVAERGPLVAMKLHAYLDRSSDESPKRASDVSDLYQLLLTRPERQVVDAPDAVREAIAELLDLAFVQRVDRARRALVKGGDEAMRAISASDLETVAGRFLAAIA